MNLKIYRPVLTDDVVTALDTGNGDIIEIDPDIAAVNTYVTIAGIAGGKDGRLIVIHNKSVGKNKDLLFFYSNTNAAAGDRIVQPQDVVNPGSTHNNTFRLNQGCVLLFHYSSTCGGWVMHTPGLAFLGANDLANAWPNTAPSTPTYGGGGV